METLFVGVSVVTSCHPQDEYSSCCSRGVDATEYNIRIMVARSENPLVSASAA